MLIFRLLNRHVFMSPDGDAGGAGGAGAPPAGGDPAASGAATGGTTTAATGDPAAATGTTEAQTHNSAPDWRESIADADLKKFVTDKGYKDPAEAFKALRDADTKAAAPATPDDYKLGDGALEKAAATWFHEQGVSAEVAKNLVGKWNAHVTELTAQADAARIAAGEKQMADLKTEWGTSYDTNLELGRQAMRKFGVPVEFIDKLSGTVGDAEVVKVFNRIGAAMSEGTLNPGGAGGSGAALTDEQRAAKFYAS